MSKFSQFTVVIFILLSLFDLLLTVNLCRKYKQIQKSAEELNDQTQQLKQEVENMLDGGADE